MYNTYDINIYIYIACSMYHAVCNLCIYIYIFVHKLDLPINWKKHVPSRGFVGVCMALATENEVILAGFGGKGHDGNAQQIIFHSPCAEHTLYRLFLRRPVRKSRLAHSPLPPCTPPAYNSTW